MMQNFKILSLILGLTNILNANCKINIVKATHLKEDGSSLDITSEIKLKCNNKHECNIEAREEASNDTLIVNFFSDLNIIKILFTCENAPIAYPIDVEQARDEINLGTPIIRTANSEEVMYARFSSTRPYTLKCSSCNISDSYKRNICFSVFFLSVFGGILTYELNHI
jgi:hypothetical protein